MQYKFAYACEGCLKLPESVTKEGVPAFQVIEAETVSQALQLIDRLDAPEPGCYGSEPDAIVLSDGNQLRVFNLDHSERDAFFYLTYKDEVDYAEPIVVDESCFAEDDPDATELRVWTIGEDDDSKTED